MVTEMKLNLEIKREINMPIYIFCLVAIVDVFTLLTLFPTPLRRLLLNFIDLSDGSGLINFALAFIVINVLALISLLIPEWRERLLNENLKWLVNFCLVSIIIYSVIGLIALYEMHIVGLK